MTVSSTLVHWFTITRRKKNPHFLPQASPSLHQVKFKKAKLNGKE